MSNKNYQNGFTLIELLIVVLIIGILASIAIPVFNGQRTKAKNSVAQSTVRNAMTAARSAATGNNDRYAGIVINSATNKVALQDEESTIKAGQETEDAKKAGNGADDKAIYIGGVDSVPTAAGAATVNGITICAASKGNTAYCFTQKTDGSGKVIGEGYGKGANIEEASTQSQGTSPLAKW